MLHRLPLLLPLLLLSACGDFHNPFVSEKPFIPSAVPDDFAIIVDENHDTFTTRQHVQQVITAHDGMSTTTYTTYRDYNNSIAERFRQETPLTPSQLQAMWNSVSSQNAMSGSSHSINWLADTDLHQRNSYIIQIRADDQTRTYKETNGFPGRVRSLMLLVSAVRLPVSQHDQTPVVGAPTSDPATSMPAMPMPGTAPATLPASMSTTAPALSPASAIQP